MGYFDDNSFGTTTIRTGSSSTPEASDYSDEMGLLEDFQGELEGSISEFRNFLENDASPEQFAKPYEEFMDKFGSNMNQMFAQQSASQQNQLGAQVQASRDRRPWVIQEKTDQLERQIEQNYVKNMMKANQWYTEGLANAVSQSKQIQAQGEQSIMQTASNVFAVNARFLGEMMSQRGANYRAELQRSSQLASIRSREELAEAQMAHEADMAEYETDVYDRRFQQSWDMLDKKAAEKRKTVEMFMDNSSEGSAQTGVNRIVDEVNDDSYMDQTINDLENVGMNPWE